MKNLLLLIPLILYACSSNKQPVTPPSLDDETVVLLSQALYPEEALESGQLLLTFTTSAKGKHHFDLFKLGLIDVTVEVLVNDELIRHSLYGKLVPEDFYLGDAKGVDLTAIGDDYLYAGIFNVPAGELKKVEVAFSGTKSDIIVNGSELALVDSLFALFPKKPDDNSDELSLQRFPVRVSQGDIQGIQFIEGDLTPLAIDIKQHESITLETLESTDGKQYGFFSPMFTIAKLPKKNGFTKPFKLRFRQIDTISFSEDDAVMLLGTLSDQLLVTEYILNKTDNIIVDGDFVTALSAVKGLAAIDITGSLAINQKGYFYYIDRARIDLLDSDSGRINYEGYLKMMDNKGVRLAGKRLPLVLADHSHLNGQAFTGQIAGRIDQGKVGDLVTITQSSDGLQLHIVDDKPLESTSPILDINTTIVPFDADLLNLEMNNQEGDRIDLSQPLDCQGIVSDCKQGQQLSTLDFSNAANDFTLLVTRRGQLIQDNDDIEFIKSPALIKRYTDKKQFLESLRKQVKIGYRIYRLTAVGEFSDNIFYINKDTRLIVFQPNTAIDNTNDKPDENLAGNIQGAALSGPGDYLSKMFRIRKTSMRIRPSNTSLSTSFGKVIRSATAFLTNFRLPNRKKNAYNKAYNHAVFYSVMSPGQDKEGNVIIDRNFDEPQALNNDNKALSAVKTKKIAKIDDIPAGVREYVSEVNATRTDGNRLTLSFPDADSKRPTPPQGESINSYVSKVLKAAGIQTGVKDLPVLLNINMRLRGMSQTEFDDTLSFRNQYEKLKTLLVAENFIDADKRLKNLVGDMTPADINTDNFNQTLASEADNIAKKLSDQKLTPVMSQLSPVDETTGTVLEEARSVKQVRFQIIEDYVSSVAETSLVDPEKRVQVKPTIPPKPDLRKPVIPPKPAQIINQANVSGLLKQIEAVGKEKKVSSHDAFLQAIRDGVQLKSVEKPIIPQNTDVDDISKTNVSSGNPMADAISNQLNKMSSLLTRYNDDRNTGFSTDNDADEWDDDVDYRSLDSEKKSANINLTKAQSTGLDTSKLSAGSNATPSAAGKNAFDINANNSWVNRLSKQTSRSIEANSRKFGRR